MPSLEDAVRKLVREELDKRESKPSRKRVEPLWLGLVAANLGLLLWLVSDRFFELIDNPRFEMIVKLVGVIGGSALVASYTAWRNRFVAAMDQKWFRRVLVGLFPLLVTLHLDIVPVTAQVEPRLAELWIDGERVATPGGTAKLGLKLRRHAVQLRPDKALPHLDIVDFQFGWREIFHALFGVEPFRWSLLWPVGLSSLDPITELTIERVDGRAFGSEFLEIAEAYSLRPASAGVLTLRAGAPITELAFSLPAGEYRFLAKHTVPQCKGEAKPVTVSARLPRFDVKFDDEHQ